MDIKDGFVGTIGNTPLIRLNSFSEETGCEILGKAEFLNPGGSVKDRAALYIIQEAEKQGQLKPGGTVVEGTAGNTGIGLAHICNAKGYKCVIVIPETQSQEKMDMLRMLGAEVRPVPAVPYRDPNNYVKLSGRIAAEMDNAIWANQFDNLANRLAHYETTAPEIWQQTQGQISAWVAATGTGGTFAGASLFFKEKNPEIKCVLAEPYGSGLYNYVKTGEIKAHFCFVCVVRVFGIGQSFSYVICSIATVVVVKIHETITNNIFLSSTAFAYRNCDYLGSNRWIFSYRAHSVCR